MRRHKLSRSTLNGGPKRVLRLPDLDHAKSSVLNTLGSSESQRTYRFAIDDFIAWYCSEPRIAFNKTVVLRYRIPVGIQALAPATINVRLAAVRRLAYEEADTGLLSPELAATIRTVKGAKRLGVRLGNWLSTDQAKALLGSPNRQSLAGKRDYAILAVLLACGLRRSEAALLNFAHLQRRDEQWAIVDLYGKGGHVRSIPVPDWVKSAIDEWSSAAAIDSGKVFRCVTRQDHAWGHGITDKVIWHVLRKYAPKAGVDHVAPHDLRRTCAKLCHVAGGELEQIQFLLGHRSVQTTERYLGCKQRFRFAVNHAIGIEPGDNRAGSS